ncbi:MAG: hypothetical protein R6W91_01900 [Thermoplasmata archaeon]
MASILNFSDIGCLNESAAGSLGAGMASFVRAGFPAARGFIVTPLAFSDFLDREEIKAALELFKSGAETPEESWRAVKSVFAKSRLNWSHEMEILAAFGELDSAVSIVSTSLHGASAAPVYATAGQDVLEGIKHCWLKWLGTGFDRLGQDMPAVAIREVLDSEISIELRRKGQELRARAVFGLPEGLVDPTVSGDIFEFTHDGKLERMEMRQQNFQYVLKGHGPSKVEISSDFRDEEKVTGEMLAELEGTITFILEHAGMASCTVCFVSGRPVICSAMLLSESAAETDIPARERSISLLEPAKHAPAPASQGPVVATRLFLRTGSMAELGQVSDTYLDGIIIPGNPQAKAEPNSEVAAMASEAKRRFRASHVILELGGPGLPPSKLADAIRIISEVGMQPGILIPGIRSAEELSGAVRTMNSTLGDLPEPAVWVRVMYPSNLFFMESLARASDVLALDLDSLARLMLGSDEGNWLQHSIPALEGALENAFGRKPGPFAILSDDIVSMPGMLEFLVRRSADIICMGPSEVSTVKHIIASVEKRMLLEQGRA